MKIFWVHYSREGFNCGAMANPSFDAKTNFSIWQNTLNDVLVQQGLFKALLDKRPKDMKDDDWEELQGKTISTILLDLASKIKYTWMNETSSIKLWKKMEKLYMPNPRQIDFI